MKLKSKNGRVSFLMLAGTDHVKSEMPLSDAERLCRNGEVTTCSQFHEYPICVDGKYFFAGEPPKPRKRKQVCEN